jgi:hypothetical protein
MDFTGTEITNTTQYITLAMPINRGQVNELLESHIDEGLVPTSYVGNRNPIDDDLWIMVHAWPLAEQDRNFAATSYPQLNFDTLMSKVMLPVLNARFGLHTNDLPLCFERWKNCVKAYIEQRFCRCPDSINSPITCRNITLCIIMYPVIHDTPILIHDGDQTYISETLLPSNIVGTDNIELVNMAITTTASALAVCKKDPSSAEIGHPGNLANYLPDSGAIQHMTPHRADLFDEVEGQNLGVEVADGHIIKS